jgi:hypothetical protein
MIQPDWDESGWQNFVSEPRDPPDLSRSRAPVEAASSELIRDALRRYLRAA